MDYNFKKHQILKHLYKFSVEDSMDNYDNTLGIIAKKIGEDIVTTEIILNHLEEEIYIASENNNNTATEHYFILDAGDKAYLSKEFLNKTWWRNKTVIGWGITIIIALITALITAYFSS